jgi:hypothetical protein
MKKISLSEFEILADEIARNVSDVLADCDRSDPRMTELSCLFQALWLKICSTVGVAPDELMPPPDHVKLDATLSWKLNEIHNRYVEPPMSRNELDSFMFLFVQKATRYLGRKLM